MLVLMDSVKIVYGIYSLAKLKNKWFLTAKNHEAPVISVPLLSVLL